MTMQRSSQEFHDAFYTVLRMLPADNLAVEELVIALMVNIATRSGNDRAERVLVLNRLREAAEKFL
jgi:hypothetical protein